MPENIIETITIPLEEYRKLVEAFTRVKIFSEHVQAKKYSIGREECGMFLGFEVANGED